MADIKKIPEAERKHLTKNEYTALQQLFGTVSAFLTQLKYIEKRAKMVPNLWRNLRMIQSVAYSSLEQILETVPTKKLMMLQQELKKTKVTVSVDRDVTGKKQQEFCYVPEKELVRTVSRVINWECTFCEKSPAERKKCQIRKDLEAIYPWELTGSDEICKLSEMSIPIE